MFSLPLAVVSCAVVHDHPQLLSVIAEFDPSRQTKADFIRVFSENYSFAGDETFGYRLAEKTKMGIVRDYFTKESLGSGGEGAGDHDGGPAW